MSIKPTELEEENGMIHFEDTTSSLDIEQPEQSSAKKEKKSKKLKVDEKQYKDLQKKAAKIDARPDRGIETWFRLTSSNLYVRRQIVDTKSSMLLTTNTIILSIVLGSTYRDLANDPHLAIATVPLVVSCLLSIAFSIKAARPRIQTGVFSVEDVYSHKVSLMTFDDFYAMKSDDYERAIDHILSDRELLYGSIKSDIYRLGVDLSHRYKHLERAYNIFIFGISLAVVLFTLCHIFYAD